MENKPTKIQTLNDVPSIAAYLARINARPRSIRSAVVEEVHGRYWKDLHVIRFHPGDKKHPVNAPEELAPTDAELEAILKDIDIYQWPASKLLGKVYELPTQLKKVDPENLFEFRNREGQLVMLQQRTEETDRGKYRPWTPFDDYLWRMCEPDGQLPIWGMEHLGEHTTVFIHEGAKAARAMHRLVNPTNRAGRDQLARHPWGLDLVNAAHLGWIGGALNPDRTNWVELAKCGVKQAFIVADNDAPGLTAVPTIARYLQGVTVFLVRFNQLFPPSFDMADEWPEQFFIEKDGERIYQGPTFNDHLRPATWATDLVKVGKKNVAKLRDEFKKSWGWVSEVDLYVCLQRPTLRFPDKVFEGHVAAFSHHNSKVAELVKRDLVCHFGRMAYRPDRTEFIIGHFGEAATINLFTPSGITPLPGDATPWIEFLTYLIPDKEERREMMRWVATLIARPDIRMSYAVLMVSETQGVGKNTLGEKILAPLVGMHNCSFPDEQQVVDSQFNSWLVNKRFAFIAEIYSGRSWKATNKLKSHITDRTVHVNEKYIKPHDIDNWIHVMACSNSLRALKLDATDRRWFVPTLTETPWPREKWIAFNEWIEGNGLRIILHWAKQFGDYVKTGEHAPMTERKGVMQRESESDAMQLLRSWCEANEDIPITVVERAMRDFLERSSSERRIYESSTELRRIMASLGWETFNERLRIDGLKQWVIMSPQVSKELASLPQDIVVHRKFVRATIKLPVDSKQAML